MITCTVTSAETTKIYENLQSVALPAYSGFMEILPGHAESFVIVNAGELILKYTDKHGETIRIAGGECHVYRDKVILIM